MLNLDAPTGITHMGAPAKRVRASPVEAFRFILPALSIDRVSAKHYL